MKRVLIVNKHTDLCIKRHSLLVLFGVILIFCVSVFADIMTPVFKVSLKEAHKGTLEIDTKLMDSYGEPSANIRQFYLEARDRL